MSTERLDFPIFSSLVEIKSKWSSNTWSNKLTEILRLGQKAGQLNKISSIYLPGNTHRSYNNLKILKTGT